MKCDCPIAFPDDPKMRMQVHRYDCPNVDVVDTSLPSYEVRHAEAERAMREIANSLKREMPKGFGFTLFIFEYAEKGATFYISSARRKDMIETLKEFIAMQEQQNK